MKPADPVEGKQPAICRCGAEIIQVRECPQHNGVKYWTRRGTGEVCSNNHWHSPMTPPIEEEKMSDEQVVKQVYKGAWCQFSTIFKEWRVYQYPFPANSTVGIGSTESAAWADAAAKLREEPSKSIEECGATGEGHHNGPYGPKGEIQCRYCGEPSKPQEKGDHVICPKHGPRFGFCEDCIEEPSKPAQLTCPHGIAVDMHCGECPPNPAISCNKWPDVSEFVPVFPGASHKGHGTPQPQEGSMATGDEADRPMTLEQLVGRLRKQAEDYLKAIEIFGTHLVGPGRDNWQLLATPENILKLCDHIEGKGRGSH